MFKKTCLALTLSAFSYAAHAQTVQQYAQTCINELGLSSIPAFSCSDGIPAPEVDMNAYVGSINTGNPDVDAVYLCRGVHSSIRVSLIGLIIHNKANNKACFFDANAGSNPTSVSPTSTNAHNYWKSPASIEADTTNGRCHQCHANDPIVVTPYIVEELTELDMLNNGRNLLAAAPYHVVGQDFAGWNTQLQQNFSNETCAAACHRMSTSTKFTSIKNATASEMPPAPNSYYSVSPLPFETGFEGVSGEDVLTGPVSGQNAVAWRIGSGKTPTGVNYATGPNGGAGSTRYYFVETSAGQGAYVEGDMALAHTGYFDLANSTLEFDYHLHGSDIGNLYVSVGSANAGGWISVWSKGTESLSPDWQSASVYLGYYTAFGPLQVQFRYSAGGGHLGDAAIDNVSLTRN